MLLTRWILCWNFKQLKRIECLAWAGSLVGLVEPRDDETNGAMIMICESIYLA